MFNVDPTVAALMGYRQAPYDDPVRGLQPPTSVPPAGLTPAQWELFQHQAASTRVPKTPENAGASDYSGTPMMVRRMFGMGTERIPSWPERLVRDIADMPAALDRAGQFPALSQEAEAELMPGAQAIAGLAGGAGAFSAPRGALGAAGGRLKAPDAPPAAASPFYSAVGKAVEGAKMPKMPLDQWVNWLRGQPGVKEEELNWLGLGRQPAVPAPGTTASTIAFDDPAMVTRPELTQWVQQQGTQVKDVNKPDAVQRWHLRYKDGSGSFQDYATKQEAEAAIKSIGAGDRMEAVPYEGTNPTKYAKYQLPGGQNYREQLLTLPDRGPRPPADINTAADAKAWDDFAAREYQSQHWDEPNVLAHVRMSDRELPPAAPGGSPRKTLFLEEVQSDWHQAGRKSGYAGPKPTAAEAAAVDKAWQDAGMPHLTAKNWGSGYRPLEVAQKAAQEGRMSPEGLRAIEDYAQKSQASLGVPDAPFKQTWPDLALKRMIHRAAQEGYDAVAWTPGDVQAARYDLSKQISNLSYDPTWKTFRAYDKNGRQVLEDTSASPERVHELIGKEAAEKLFSAPTDHWGIHKLEGQDIQTGGAGMRAFYDRMLVDRANALGKKHGARVTQEGMPVVDNQSGWGVRETPRGWRLWNRNTDEYFGGDLGSRAEAEARLHKIYGASQQQVHVLPITPALRKAALGEGFPLFVGGPGPGLTALASQDQQDRALRAIMTQPPQ